MCGVEGFEENQTKSSDIEDDVDVKILAPPG